MITTAFVLLKGASMTLEESLSASVSTHTEAEKYHLHPCFNQEGKAVSSRLILSPVIEQPGRGKEAIVPQLLLHLSVAL